MQHEFADKLFATALKHLGYPVQNLATKVGTRFRPASLRLARGHNRIAEAFAAAAAHVGDDIAPFVFEREVAPRLSAWKLAIDIDLVGFRDCDALLFRRGCPDLQTVQCEYH